MADAYLNVAERVIQSSRRPLRPKEIIQQAYGQSLLPWHLHGPRQDKTLHARISEDISRNPEGSRFFRTGPGVFFLKELIVDPNIPDLYKVTYLAPPRRKNLRRDRVLAIRPSGRIAPDRSSFQSAGLIQSELAREHFDYLSYSEMVGSHRPAAVHSFVVVFRDDMVLSYRCGKFAPSTDPIYGLRSIGLSGPVYAADRDLLFESMHGIIGSGINELGYGIGLPRKLAERARYGNEVKPHLCMYLPGTNERPAVIHVILGYECPFEFMPSKAALSVNDLRWVSIEHPTNRLEDYDETSRQLFLSGKIRRIRTETAAK